MATIKDIALLAGVSHGTVSNVLNKKGNVSAEKIQAVEDAAKKLRYEINSQAQQLRAGMGHKICVILPGLELRRYNDFLFGLEHHLRNHNFDIDLVCTDDLELNEEHAVKKAISQNALAIVIASASIKKADEVFCDSRFYFIEREPKGLPSEISFVSFDFELAGKQLAQKCIEDGKKKVAVLSGNKSFSNIKKTIEAISAIFDEANISYKVFSSNSSMRLANAFDIFNSKEDFDAAIVLSEEDIANFREAQHYVSSSDKIEMYALVSKTAFRDSQIKTYMLNYKLLGMTVAQQIIKREENIIGTSKKNSRLPTYVRTIIDNDGFVADKKFFSIQNCNSGKKTQINFLTMNNSTSRAIKMLLPRFTKETGISVNMVAVSYDELYKMASACREDTPYDLLRIDMTWMSELGNEIFCELDENEEAVKNIERHIFPTLSVNYSMLHGIKYAFPLDPCVQMLFYRRDLFENELIKREFFEMHKKRLEVPKTFSEFNEVARFFTKKENKNSKTDFGTTASYGRTFLASVDFLPRFRELKNTVFDADGRVNILLPEMYEAIHSYLESMKYSNKEICKWWDASTYFFSEGNIAMHIVFSSYASGILYSADSKIIGQTAYAVVPGGQPVSGGGSVGILKSSKKYDACMEFLNWIYRVDVAEKIVYMGGYICNNAISKNVDVIAQYPWMADMEKVFAPGWRSYDQNVNEKFDEFLFEDILGKAIRSIVLGIEPVDEALMRAQAECDAEFNLP